jgi:polar amino acid transport system substrate-binding protein
VKYVFPALLGLALGGLAFFAKANSNTHLTIVTEHLAPFQIVDKDSISGFSTEIVEATLEAAGYPYNLDVHPWSIAYKRATEESNICIYSLVRMPLREEKFQWIGHIVSGTTSFYGLKSRQDIAISSVEDAKRFRTAVIQDDITHEFLLSKGFTENQNLYASSNYDALLKLLEVPSRNIDLVIINDDLIYYRSGGTEDIDKYTNLYNINELKLDFHFACSMNTDKDIVAKLRATMKTLEDNQTLNKIRAKWRPKLKSSP